MSFAWGQLMEQLAGVLRNEKISVSIMVMALFGAVYAYGWAQETYVPKTDFNALKTEVEEGFENAELRDASQTIRLLKIDLRIAKATGASDSEINDMQLEYETAKKYKECLRARGPNCEHLKEPD